MTDLLFATGNKGKYQEVKAILAELPINLLMPSMIGIEKEVEEVGMSYAENAQIKAKTLFSLSGLITIADDSGLEIEALNGAPGIHSARFSPLPSASDQDRRKLLLDTLQPYPPPWKASFHCTIAIADITGKIYLTKGECSGIIINEERGEYGFGYDPIFLIPDYDLTMAELPLDQKNLISHRAKALIAAKPILLKLLDDFG